MLVFQSFAVRLLTFKRPALITAAMIALIVDMTVPRLYPPAAVLWLGLSHLFGHSGLQNPFNAGFLYRRYPAWSGTETSGFDSLKLKDFESDENSVMVIRNHIFTGKDIEKPY